MGVSMFPLFHYDEHCYSERNLHVSLREMCQSFSRAVQGADLLVWREHAYSALLDLPKLLAAKVDTPTSNALKYPCVHVLVNTCYCQNF